MTALKIVLITLGALLLYLGLMCLIRMIYRFLDPDYPFRTTETVLREGFVLDASRGNFGNYTVRFKKPI